MADDITTTHTVEEFIEQGSVSTSITYDKLLYKAKSSDGDIVSLYNVLSDYYDELMSISVLATMNEKHYQEFMYKPKLLSYWLYGTTELFFVLLLLNNISNAKQFDFKTLRIIKPEDLPQVLSYIYATEQPNLLRNRVEIGEV